MGRERREGIEGEIREREMGIKRRERGRESEKQKGDGQRV